MQSRVESPLPDPQSAAQPSRPPGRIAWRGRGVLALLAFQLVCLIVFISDVAMDFREAGWSLLQDIHVVPELMAALGLGVSILFVGRHILRSAERQRQLEQGMSVASGALSGLMEGYFATWGLTPTEQAVATFTIKGYSIAEIAGLRGSAEGTIKTHLNAIYRKAGVSGRAQLVSLLIEDLMREPLVGGAAQPAGWAAGQA